MCYIGAMSFDAEEKKSGYTLDIQLDIPESWKKELTLDKMLDRFEDAGEPFSGIFLFLVAILNNVLTDVQEIKQMLQELEKRL